jgi:hypothetical protein
MKKFLIITFGLLIGCSSKPDKYKYRIYGNVEIVKGDSLVDHPAIWLTDTIYFIGDTVCYDNSDGSTVKIKPPYTIKDEN